MRSAVAGTGKRSSRSAVTGSASGRLVVSEAYDERTVAFAAERPHLLAVAFRILGSDADTQDVVQEAWARYEGAEVSAIRSTQAWLTTVVTRLCIDLLRRSRTVPCDDEQVFGDLPSRDDPEETALLAAELAEAFLVVLDRLSPEQRVAFVLHDVFGTPFEEVGHVLATTPGSAKTLASRARGRLRADLPYRRSEPGDIAAARPAVAAFLTAAQHGDVASLVGVLHPEITRTADPQALPSGAPQRACGVEAIVAETQSFQARAQAARLVTIDGSPGIAVMANGKVVTALVVVVADDLVRHYDVVADPARLARLRIEGSGS